MVYCVSQLSSFKQYNLARIFSIFFVISIIVKSLFPSNLVSISNVGLTGGMFRISINSLSVYFAGLIKTSSEPKNLNNSHVVQVDGIWAALQTCFI